MQKVLKNYSLSLVLAALFLFSWAAQGVTEWHIVTNEAEQHGEEFQVSEWAWSFAQSTFENWQSEYLQLLSFVILSTYLVHKGSPQSRDGDDEMRQKMEDLDTRLKGIEGQTQAFAKAAAAVRARKEREAS